MKTILTLAITFAAMTLVGQSKKDSTQIDIDSMLVKSTGRISVSYIGSKISDFGNGEYEFPGAKYQNGKIIVTDSAKAINELMKGYIILNNRIPKIYDEMGEEIRRQRQLTNLYKGGYARMSNLIQSMLGDQKHIINSLTKKKIK